MAYTGIANGRVVQTASGDLGHHTFDSIEIAHQLVVLYNGMGFDQEAFWFQYGAGGTVLENLYVHDWASNSTVSPSLCPASCFEYSVGAVLGGTSPDPSPTTGVRVLNSSFTDQGGYFFTTGGTKVNGGFGGACRYCAEVGGSPNSSGYTSVFAYGQAACFDVAVCDNTEFHDIDDLPIENYDGPAPNGIHSQVIEDDAGGASLNYNNYIHDNRAAVQADICAASPFFNNVVARNNPWSGAGSNAGLIVDTSCGSGSAGPSNIYNNTFDGSAISGAACVRFIRPGGTIGTVNEYNNIQLNCSDQIAATITHYNHSNNYPMGSAEANTYGFTAANKYSPSSADPNTVGKGVTPNPSCTGNLTQLCLDASGAPWFGGSYKNRPSTAWDLGAFQGQGGGGGSGPPVVAFTSPAAGNVSGTVALTVTATPQGTATISSCQFSIDGFSFGSAITSSPYTLNWNTNTASNARAHTITAVCTDSNSQTGSAGPVNATPTNSHPNGFVSDKCGFSGDACTVGPPNQTFTAQTSGTVVYPICIRPYTTTGQDNEIGLSQALPTTYGDFSTIISIQPGGYITFYKPGTGYTTDAGPTAYPVVASTQYCFNWTVNMTAQTSWLSETSPVAQTIVASPGYAFRAAATSLGFLSAYSSTNSTPDTVEVANFSTPATPALSFSPGNLTFPDTTVGSTSMQTDSVTVTNGPATITGVTLSGSGFTLDASSTCPSSGSLSSACTYVVDLTPTSVGAYSGTLTVTGNQTGSPQVFNLSGNGVAVAPMMTPSQTSLNVGNTLPHHTIAAGPVRLTITNGPATITGVTFTGGNAADFGFASNDCPGSVMTSCQVVVSFTPTIIGTETTTLRFTSSDASNSPVDVTVTGQGVTRFPVALSPNLMLR